MLALLPAPLRGCLTGFLLGLNTLVLATCMIPPALIKLLVPTQAVRRLCDRTLNGLASAWVGNNNAWIAAVRPATWDVQGVDKLHPRGWYLVSCNHQSWVDILVLQRIFHGHIPFLKFFLKQELIWVPVIGLAWWALDFPFMKRGKGQGAQRNDLKTTRQACEKFKLIPTSVINFVEGTRFTPAKHAAQKSPYRHLLKPKIGGLGIALAAMGEQFEALLDVTIVYPHGTPTFWDLLSGRLDAVIVRVQQCAIPPEVLGSDPVTDKAYRQRIGRWVDGQWSDKDRLIDQLLPASARRPAGPPVQPGEGAQP
jgi:1-acyl-sn-glycerol-3-phosphate acyltransferase